MTYHLLRKKNARMALAVRNIIAGEPLVEDSPLDGEHSDRFRVKLDSSQVLAIVESLSEYNLRDMEGGGQPCANSAAKSLLEDWVVLAARMIEELPSNRIT